MNFFICLLLSAATVLVVSATLLMWAAYYDWRSDKKDEKRSD